MLKFYCFFSIAITFGAIYNSFNVHKQFYPSVLYLSTNKINRTILVNFAIMIVSTLIMIFLKIMFGELKELEKISVIDKTKRKILEVAYLLFFFYNQLDWQFICNKFNRQSSFNALVNSIINNSLDLNKKSWIFNCRILNKFQRKCKIIGDIYYPILYRYSSNFIIIIIQNQISLYFFYGTEEKFQNVLFGFEFMLLPIRIALPFIKYVINLFEILTLSQFDFKQTIFSGLEVVSTILKLCVQIMLFQYVLNTQGFLLILFVDTFENTFAMWKKLKAFYNQVKLVRMIDKIQDVEKIESHDSTCLICLNELESGKQLSCGHVYHKSCLKTWISGNSNQFCPKCKQPIKLEETKVYQTETQTKNLKKQILLQELREIRSNIQLLQILNQCRNIQNNLQNTKGIGNVQYALPCEALQYSSGMSEIKRLQINYMNKIMRGIETGIIENYLLPK